MKFIIKFVVVILLFASCSTYKQTVHIELLLRNKDNAVIRNMKIVLVPKRNRINATRIDFKNEKNVSRISLISDDRGVIKYKFDFKWSTTGKPPQIYWKDKNGRILFKTKDKQKYKFDLVLEEKRVNWNGQKSNQNKKPSKTDTTDQRSKSKSNTHS